MPTDFESVKKLPPETRVVELQRIIANLKKHIDEHNKDIRTAEILLSQAENEEQVLEKQLGETVSQTQNKYKTDKTTLETPKTPAQKPTQKLENIVGETQGKEIPRAAELPLSELYMRAKTIYESQQRTGIETYEQKKQLYEINKGLEEKKQDMELGKYRIGERQKHLLTSTEQLVGNMYESNKEGQNKTYRTNN